MTTGRLGAITAAMHAFVEATADCAALLEVVTTHSADALRCCCGMSLLSEDGAALVPTVASDCNPVGEAAIRDAWVKDSTCREPSTPIMRSLHEGATVVAERLVGADGDCDIKNVIYIPLRARGRVLGVLTLIRHGADAAPFDDDERSLAESLASHAALAIAKARLFADARREIEERNRMEARLRLLSEATREFSEATRDYRRLLDVIARKLSDVVGELCGVRLLGPDGESLEKTGSVYHPDPRILVAAREHLLRQSIQRDDTTLTGRILLTGQPLLLPRIDPAQFAAAVEPRHRPFVEQLGVRSMLAVPLLFEGRAFGIIIMIRSRPDHPYGDDDLQLVQDLAAQAALAITNSRFFDASERMSNRLRLLTELTREFAISTGDYPVLMELIARRLGEIVGETCSIRMVPVGSQHFSTVAGLYHPDPVVLAEWRAWVSEFPQRIDEGVSGRALATGQAILIPSITAEQLAAPMEGQRTIIERLAIRSVMAVPLRAEGKPIGVAIMTRSDPDDPYTPDDRDLLEDLASHASIAITNSQLFVSLQRELAERQRAETALGETEEQLRQAQKMEAIGRLAGGVAHDFNNVLSVILSYSQLLLDDMTVTDSRCADVEEIKKAGERAADLTRQLLAFSRQQVIQPRVVDLNDIIKGMAKMNRRLVGEDVEYRTVPTPGLGKVMADPGHIEQVIMNLVVNARDAMPLGGRLTIETAEVVLDEGYAAQHVGVKPGPHVMLAVSDTGTGMDKATQQRIFEPFFTTKEMGKGTGLGLSTVFGIVQQSGGSVWVYSESGQGATFKIYFPRTDEMATPIAPKVVVATLRGSETILLVEDEDQLRVVARGILQRSGYRVLEAANGGEALLLCEKHQGEIQLLFTDVVMPRMSGRELAERLQPLRPAMKVLYMSGYTDDAIVHHRVLAPGIVLLQKPITPDNLLRKVREVLNVTA